MTISLELSREEAQLLLDHLASHLKHMDAELVRTDKRELQHAIAVEEKALQGVVDRLRTVTEH
jgi:hypothetical protein